MPVTTVSDRLGGYGTRVEVSSPLTKADLQLLPEGRSVVQFDKPMHTRDHELLGSWFDAHPDADLRAWGTLPPTLDFLRHYPRLNHFTLDCGYRKVTDATGLGYLPETLRSLVIDVRLPGRDDLDTLSRLRGLNVLGLGSIRRLPASISGLPVVDLQVGDVKSLQGIGALTQVRNLRLDNVSASLDPLLDCHQMSELTLAGGGCSDLTPLAGLTRLRSFSAWLVRGLSDVAPVIVAPGLETLHLERLRRVSALPSFANARSLSRITLIYLRGLSDLTPLQTAPALHELMLTEMQHLSPDDVAALAGHPTLRRASVGLGSDRKNLAVRDALRIPGEYGGHLWPPPT